MSSDIVLLIFDLLIAGVGVYLLFAAYQMKNKKTVPSAFLADGEADKCKDPDGLAEFLYKKTLIFGLFSVICGGLCALEDLKLLPIGDMAAQVLSIVMIAGFVGLWIWFTNVLKDARSKFFSIM